jgi:gas vesicle protein
MSKQDEAASFVTGFLIGGLVGAATALLLAPQSGEDTRTQIREKSIQLKERAEVTYADLHDKIDASTKDLRARVEDLSSKMDQAIAQGKERFAKKVPVDEALPEQVSVEDAPAEA